MPKGATYYKARLDAIGQLIAEERGGDRAGKDNFSVLLRNGVVPEGLKERYEKAFKKHQRAWLRSGNQQGLSFSDLTRFNTWFELHPEKVAGEERITTSREFPISIIGTQEDIVSTVGRTLKKGGAQNKQRGATLVPDRHKGYGYSIRMVDGRPFQGSHTDTFAWYRLKRDGIKAINANPKLRYAPLKNVKGKDVVSQDNGKRVRIIRAKAEAKLKLLNLLKI